jgi:hypothetical protein
MGEEKIVEFEIEYKKMAGEFFTEKYIVEFIKGSPVPLRIEEIGQKVGLFFLISLMILALFNDVNRFLIG